MLNWMMLVIARDVALGAFVGASGVFPATLLQMMAKQARNALLARRGQPGIMGWHQLDAPSKWYLRHALRHLGS